MEDADIKRLRELEDENRRLKQISPDLLHFHLLASLRSLAVCRKRSTTQPLDMLMLWSCFVRFSARDVENPR